jgi:hypothetical protein
MFGLGPLELLFILLALVAGVVIAIVLAVTRKSDDGPPEA